MSDRKKPGITKKVFSAGCFARAIGTLVLGLSAIGWGACRP